MHAKTNKREISMQTGRDSAESASEGGEESSEERVEGSGRVHKEEAGEKREEKIECDDDLLAGIEVQTTEEVEVPNLLVDQVIGQEHAVEVIKKAAKQRRHVLLIGTPGTGKSMLARSMAELLPKEELQDILVYPNFEDKNNPKIRVCLLYTSPSPRD